MRTKNLRRQINSLQKGFSLVEIMVVIVIIGILAGVVVKNLMGNVKKAHDRTVQADFKTISESIDLYQLDVRAMPNTLDDLLTNAGQKGWTGPYLKNKPLDPNGNPYIFERLGDDKYILKASGYDGKEGTDDDLSTADDSK